MLRGWLGSGRTSPGPPAQAGDLLNNDLFGFPLPPLLLQGTTYPR
jgi:hypothetical protein